MLLSKQGMLVPMWFVGIAVYCSIT